MSSIVTAASEFRPDEMVLQRDDNDEVRDEMHIAAQLAVNFKTDSWISPESTTEERCSEESGQPGVVPQSVHHVQRQQLNKKRNQFCNHPRSN